MTLRELAKTFCQDAYFTEMKRKRRRRHLLDQRKDSLGGILGSAMDTDSLADLPLLEAMRTAVTRTSINKDRLIALYQQFLAWIEEKTGHRYEGIAFPPVKISQPFERQLFMAKYLQEPGHRVEDLPGMLWLSMRRIQKDIRSLTGLRKASFGYQGEQLRLPQGMQMQQALPKEASLHPFFLSLSWADLQVLVQALLGHESQDQGLLQRVYGQVSPSYQALLKEQFGTALEEALRS